MSEILTLDNSFFKEVEAISPKEVFDQWRKNETDPVCVKHWKEHFKKNGFATWEEWRENFFRDFHMTELSWKLVEINRPNQFIPTIFGGPFTSWWKVYYQNNGSRILTLGELVRLPEMKENKKITDILENDFPRDRAIAIIKTADGKFFVAEGMHRACALAIKAKQEETLGKVLILLADGSEFFESIEKLPKIGGYKKVRSVEH